MSTFTLRYFNIPGLAETSRLLLTAAKVEWADEHPEWPQEKPNQPFGRLPVLIQKSADGKADLVLSESVTIERYIARTYGFLPADPLKAALQEQVRDRFTDTLIAFFISLSAHEEKKEELVTKFETLLSKQIEVTSQALRDNGNNGHFFGSDLTYVDIATYAFFKFMAVSGRERQESVFELVKSSLTPELHKLISVVEANPLLEAQVAKHDKLVSVLSA
ncbi:hypothetical protein IWW38_001532 [Coemansia aciculifera]|uniref:Uncharacterized protein n=1 Tax=Coemansia aciculifera TaxID=417176 RepID=A0ACC1M7V5_9FUNG|nr:hypothetical protein IWW38_001532 [Coemansia aciculifera]